MIESVNNNKEINCLIRLFILISTAVNCISKCHTIRHNHCFFTAAFVVAAAATSVLADLPTQSLQ